MEEWIIFWNACKAEWEYGRESDFILHDVYVSGKLCKTLLVSTVKEDPEDNFSEIANGNPILIVGNIPKGNTFLSILNDMSHQECISRKLRAELKVFNSIYIDKHDRQVCICIAEDGKLLIADGTLLYMEGKYSRSFNDGNVGYTKIEADPFSLSPNQEQTILAYKKARKEEYMNKPNNYEKTQISGDFTPIELGGHRIIIKDVQETTSRTGKNMIMVRFDFAQDDIQAGYFQQQFLDDIRPNKKWPNAGTQYILTEDQDGNCSRSFKTFTTSVERSNPGFSVQWGDKFASCFKNKLVGGVYGVVEEEYNGSIHSNHRLRWFCSVDKAVDAKVPEDKLLPDSQKHDASKSGSSMDDFMNIPADLEDKLPF